MKFLTLILISFFFSYCTPAKYVTSTSQNEELETFYKSGYQFLVSKRENSTVAAALNRYKENEKFMQLILIVENSSENSVLIDPMNIILIHFKNDTPKRLYVYEPQEAIDKITFSDRLVVALNSATMSMNQNNNGNLLVTQNAINSSTKNIEIDSNTISQTILKKETLFPGTMINGVSYFSLHDNGRLKVTVPIGNDNHVFYFESLN